jgi:hypothetical protein
MNKDIPYFQQSMPISLYFNFLAGASHATDFPMFLRIMGFSIAVILAARFLTP